MNCHTPWSLIICLLNIVQTLISLKWNIAKSMKSFLRHLTSILINFKIWMNLYSNQSQWIDSWYHFAISRGILFNCLRFDFTFKKPESLESASRLSQSSVPVINQLTNKMLTLLIKGILFLRRQTFKPIDLIIWG